MDFERSCGFERQTQSSRRLDRTIGHTSARTRHATHDRLGGARSDAPSRTRLTCALARTERHLAATLCARCGRQTSSDALIRAAALARCATLAPRSSLLAPVRPTDAHDANERAAAAKRWPGAFGRTLRRRTGAPVSAREPSALTSRAEYVRPIRAARTQTQKKSARSLIYYLTQKRARSV